MEEKGDRSRKLVVAFLSRLSMDFKGIRMEEADICHAAREDITYPKSIAMMNVLCSISIGGYFS